MAERLAPPGLRLELLSRNDALGELRTGTAVRLVVADLLLPLPDLPLDARRGEIDRGVHVLGDLLGVDDDAVRQRDVDVGDVVEATLHRKHGVRRDGVLVEVLLDLVELLSRVFAHGLRGVHMPKRRRELHGFGSTKTITAFRRPATGTSD